VSEYDLNDLYAGCLWTWYEVPDESTEGLKEVGGLEQSR
jgi:hypothetical protein